MSSCCRTIRLQARRGHESNRNLGIHIVLAAGESDVFSRPYSKFGSAGRRKTLRRRHDYVVGTVSG